MKSIVISLIASFLLATTAFSAPALVKMSKSGICHAPNTTYHKQTKLFTSYPTLKECLNAGGRMPKK